MTNRRLRFAAVALTALSLTATGCTAAGGGGQGFEPHPAPSPPIPLEPPSPAPGYSRHRDPAFGFTLDYPSAWQPDPAAAGAPNTAVAFAAPDGSGRVTVAVFAAREGENLDQIAAAQAESIRAQYPGSATAVRPSVMAGLPARSIEASGVPGGSASQRLTLAGGTVYIVTVAGVPATPFFDSFRLDV